jgi:hypothetical protein
VLIRAASGIRPQGISSNIKEKLTQSSRTDFLVAFQDLTKLPNPQASRFQFSLLNISIRRTLMSRR